jgi:hypothetical protein
MQPLARYEPVRILASQEDRLTRLCRDRLGDRRVVVKSGPEDEVLHEAGILLAAPPGVAPALLDLTAGEDGRPALVMQALDGSTLADPAIALDPSDAAPLLQACCQALIHLHRSGILHMDVKPSNLFLSKTEGVARVHLLDFGFSRNDTGSLARITPTLGGTPAYMAPEVLRGWAYDHRADQYSLGLTWRQLFPTLAGEPRWSGLLDRMCAGRASERFANLTQVRDELAARFDLPPREDRFPALGGGPLYGRESALEEFSELLGDPDAPERILLLGTPGTGLTRFALEALLAAARLRCSVLRVSNLADLGDQTVRGAAARFHAFLAERAEAGDRLLCVVPDVSPGLHWLPEGLAAVVRELFGSPRARRFVLRPVNAEAFAEAIAQSLGTGGGLTGELGRFLHGRTGGNFQSAAVGLREALGELSFSESGLGWCSSESGPRRLSGWRPPHPDPVARTVPPSLWPPLEICARAGASFPEPVARGLLEDFAPAGSFESLLDHGYLLPDDPERLMFATPALFERAAAATLPRAGDIDAWLNTHWVPDPRRPAEVLAACRRACALGDRARERDHLSAGLQSALDERRRIDIRQLVSSFADRETPRTSGELRERVEEIEVLLGTPRRAPSLLVRIAVAFRAVHPEMADQLLEEEAAGDDREASIEALLSLLDQQSVRRGEADEARRVAGLEARLSGAERWKLGYLDWIKARHAFYAGQTDDAEPLARDALARLRGNDPYRESLVAMFQAVLLYHRNPQEGLRLLEAAARSEQNAQLRAQMYTNICTMRTKLGDPAGSLAASDRGLAALAGDTRSEWNPGLQSRRAWALLEMGRLNQAIAVAQALAGRWSVRTMAVSMASARLAVSVGLHYRDGTRQALAEIARAWQQASTSSTRLMKFSHLRYLSDALLDLEAWELVSTQGPALRADAAGEDAYARLVQTRFDALLAHAEGRSAEALRLLVEAEPLARSEMRSEELAWFLFHRAHARLAAAEAQGDRDGAREAALWFRGAEEPLGSETRGYPRARARLERVRALAASGDKQEARREIDALVTELRETEFRGLLARALRRRAALAMEAA